MFRMLMIKAWQEKHKTEQYAEHSQENLRLKMIICIFALAMRCLTVLLIMQLIHAKGAQVRSQRFVGLTGLV